MKNLFIILICLIISSCDSHKIKKYDNALIIESDTTNIEKVKIRTH